MTNRLKKQHLILLGVAVCGAIAIWLLSNGQQHSGTERAEGLPAVTIEQLIATSDVQQGLLEAENDRDALEKWQEQILDAARQVGYNEQQLTFLSGERGLDYLQFRAKRLAFNRDMQAALLAGQAFEPIVANYPEAQDLFAVAQRLFEARNDAIDLATKTLIDASRDESGTPTLSYAAANQHALQLWQQRQQMTTEAKTQ